MSSLRQPLCLNPLSLVFFPIRGAHPCDGLSIGLFDDEHPSDRAVRARRPANLTSEAPAHIDERLLITVQTDYSLATTDSPGDTGTARPTPRSIHPRHRRGMCPHDFQSCLLSIRFIGYPPRVSYCTTPAAVCQVCVSGNRAWPPHQARFRQFRRTSTYS